MAIAGGAVGAHITRAPAEVLRCLGEVRQRSGRTGSSHEVTGSPRLLALVLLELLEPGVLAARQLEADVEAGVTGIGAAQLVPECQGQVGLPLEAVLTLCPFGVVLALDADAVLDLVALMLAESDSAVGVTWQGVLLQLFGDVVGRHADGNRSGHETSSSLSMTTMSPQFPTMGTINSPLLHCLSFPSKFSQSQ
jgi:hypothetical protein